MCDAGPFVLPLFTTNSCSSPLPTSTRSTLKPTACSTFPAAGAMAPTGHECLAYVGDGRRTREVDPVDRGVDVEHRHRPGRLAAAERGLKARTRPCWCYL